jgi:hypothetical protein
VHTDASNHFRVEEWESAVLLVLDCEIDVTEVDVVKAVEHCARLLAFVEEHVVHVP